MRQSFDVLLLLVLLVTRLRINSFAESSLFEHFQNVSRHPWMGGLLPAGAVDAFGPWMGDPVFLLLAAFSLLCFILYALSDAQTTVIGRRRYQIKSGLLWLILLALVFLPTVKLTLLRHDNLPHSYSHDGGVIQTEAAIDYFLSERNPYIESYADTPMAEWGFPQFRTALEHYPYLPATFVLSAPLKLLAQNLWGWYDQRFTYLLLFILALVLVQRQLRQRPRKALELTMLLGLNPIMGLDVIFGQNDSFVLTWVIISLWFLGRRRPLASALFMGIAWASKPTAWFLAPFWLLALWGDRRLSWELLRTQAPRVLRPLALAGAVFILFVGPYVIWDANALIDDVWRWAAGTAVVHYQIWGWGFANFVLASGTLADRFAIWPFWIPELLFSLPLLLLLLRKQYRHNTLGQVYWNGAMLLLVFSFFSRFLNENYLGYMLALFALGYYLQEEPGDRPLTQVSPPANHADVVAASPKISNACVLS
ncbi:MAG: hypothetical protein GXP37_07345 [Chloroflexi bacterium]|nr:hypothetical protein [Chloroflexota bacterium]